jgi:hypothetical protein
MADTMLAHNVYFKLHDSSAEAAGALVAACRRCLPGHEGVVYFACGTLCPDLRRPVNDLGFDVALHMVFRDRASHDAYQASEAHHRFIEENRAGWASVRVFDSVVSQSIP